MINSESIPKTDSKSNPTTAKAKLRTPLITISMKIKAESAPKHQLQTWPKQKQHLKIRTFMFLEASYSCGWGFGILLKFFY